MNNERGWKCIFMAFIGLAAFMCRLVRDRYVLEGLPYKTGAR